MTEYFHPTAGATQWTEEDAAQIKVGKIPVMCDDRVPALIIPPCWRFTDEQIERFPTEYQRLNFGKLD